MSAKYPNFAKKDELANQNVEYLCGLCQRCLDGDKKLSFALSISKEEENMIQKKIEESFDLPEEWVFFFLMKSVKLILEKYYNNNGERLY